MDPMGTPRPGMDIADLAAERAELLPERMTLAALDNGRSDGTGNNAPVNSPGSNNVVSGYSSFVQTVGNAGPFTESIVSGDTFINQW
ncbi:hypothetical protein BCD48_20670 [Pseudofrankia sp. BMG5.36]|nr:hypothetical protein BCD48_20670 [Pseudofrankia sp. BMG5.36]